MNIPENPTSPLQVMGLYRRLVFVLLVTYIPKSYPSTYSLGDPLPVKVNSLTSTHTEIPYGYYSIPLCRPPGGVRHSSESILQLLMGDRIENSPYLFLMQMNMTDIILCSIPAYSPQDSAFLKKLIHANYRVNLLLDDLPAIRYIFTVPRIGYPLGVRVGDVYYVYNHLKFKVLVHKYKDTNVARVMVTGNEAVDLAETSYMIVGFEIVPCSFQHDLDAIKGLKMYGRYPTTIQCDPDVPAMAMKENQPLVFSFEVEFVESDIDWSSRWNAYLKMENANLHWFPIINSFLVVGLLAGIVLVFSFRSVRRDLRRYEELDKESQVQNKEEVSGWKLVAEDVFRAPARPMLLCVVVGSGVQILGMVVITIMMGFMLSSSSNSRDALTTRMVFLYTGLGLAAGYVAVRLWKMMKVGNHAGWASVSCRVACFFPGIALFMLTAINLLLRGRRNTELINLPRFIDLLLMWCCMSVPLTLVGGYIASKARRNVYSEKTNEVPSEIPPQTYPCWLVVTGAGALPFGTFLLLKSTLGVRVVASNVFGCPFLTVIILLVIVCAEVSVVLTYIYLCMEDWRWWWKSFLSSGSVAVYIFLYSVYYLVFDLRYLRGPVSTTLYVGYSMLIVTAIMLATGTVGFFSSLCFVRYLFSSVKQD